MSAQEEAKTLGENVENLDVPGQARCPEVMGSMVRISGFFHPNIPHL